MHWIRPENAGGIYREDQATAATGATLTRGQAVAAA